MHLVLDSTGLELFRQGEWDAEKHGWLRRQWRKLHLAVDADAGEIAAHVLTGGHADDAAQVPGLLGQVEGVIASVTVDGAYHGEPTYAATAARQRHPAPDVVVPPRTSAVPSTDKVDSGGQSARDRHIHLMAERGRMGVAAQGSAREVRGMAVEGGRGRPDTPGATKPRQPCPDTSS